MTRNPYSGDVRDLRILRRLFEERHVSRTADHLDLAQSVVSKALARARLQFSDPLLIRASGGYQLSNYARALEPKLCAILDQIDQLSQEDVDDPSLFVREICLATADDFTILHLPGLRQQLSAVAPGIKLVIVNAGADVYQHLSSGAVDVLIEEPVPAQSRIYSHPLLSWGWSCLMSKSNPLAQQPLSLDDYTGAEHGYVSVTHDRIAPIDDRLAGLDRSRNISMIIPYFAAVPYFLEDSNLLFTVPTPLARHLAKRFNLALTPTPIEAEPLNLFLIWHDRNQYDPVHNWVRNFIFTALA